MTSLNYHGFMKINPATTITDSLSAKYSKKTEAIRRGKDARKNIKHLLSITENNTAQSISEDLDINIKTLYPMLMSMETKGEIKKGVEVAGSKNTKAYTYILTKR